MPVCPGMTGNVVVNNQNITALFHKEFRNGCCGIGGNILQARGIISFGNHNNAVRQGIVTPQVVNHLGNAGTPLADGAVHTDDVLVVLVNDGVDGNCCFSGLAVTQDKFTLAPADGDKRIHHLDARLQRFFHRGPIHDLRRLPLYRHPQFIRQRFSVVQRVAHGVYDSAQQFLVHRDFENPACPGNLITRAQVFVGVQQDDSYHVRKDIDHHPGLILSQEHQFLGLHPVQPFGPDDALAYPADSPDFLGGHGRGKPLQTGIYSRCHLFKDIVEFMRTHLRPMWQDAYCSEFFPPSPPCTVSGSIQPFGCFPSA